MATATPLPFHPNLSLCTARLWRCTFHGFGAPRFASARFSHQHTPRPKGLGLEPGYYKWSSWELCYCFSRFSLGTCHHYALGRIKQFPREFPSCSAQNPWGPSNSSHTYIYIRHVDICLSIYIYINIKYKYIYIYFIYVYKCSIYLQRRSVKGPWESLVNRQNCGTAQALTGPFGQWSIPSWVWIPRIDRIRPHKGLPHTMMLAWTSMLEAMHWATQCLFPAFSLHKSQVFQCSCC